LKQGEENGSRIYQLLLHEMCLMPSNIPAYNLRPTYGFESNQMSNTSQDNDDEHDPTFKGKKRVLAETDSEETSDDNGTKKNRFATYPTDVEMAT
jgi:hypothetical protein